MKLRQAMLLNLYVIPRLLRREAKRIEMWHGSSDEEPWYVETLPLEYFTMWEGDELKWARERYDSHEFTKARGQFIEIHQELAVERPGKRRSALVHEASLLRWGKNEV